MAAYTNPASGRVSSPFNPRRKHPVTGKVTPHEGTDVANATGTPVYAVHDGVVTRSETLSAAHGRLQWVWITSGNTETRYLHLSRRDVKVGQKVKAGQKIGLIGATGFVTGPHLHVETRVNGKPVDPQVWFAQRGVDLGGQFKPRWYTVNTATLRGRSGPGTNYRVKHRRKRGFRIYAVADVNGWAVTRYGTFYSKDYLK